MGQPLSAEQALFRLLAAAWDPRGGPPSGSIPWCGVLDLAGAHGLGALLHAATRGRDDLPAEIDNALHQARLRAAADTARGLHQLAQVREALAATGAPVLLFKGPALAETLYGDASLRPVGDLDLAVPQDQMPACRQALLDLGYAPAQVEHRPGTLLSHSGQEVFLPPPPHRLSVELHWHLFDVPYYLRHVPMEWFWDSTQTLWLGGLPFRALDAEANLIYLPAHLALHHRFRQLHSFFDLALLIWQNQGRLDWRRIGEVARSFDLLSALCETLERLAGLWPSLPLAEPRQALGALTPSRMDSRLFRLLSAGSRSTTLDFYTTLVSLPDLRSRARYAWFNLFPQPAYMRARYQPRSDWHLPFWYGYRLVGGLVRFAAMLPRARRIDRAPA